MAGCCRGRSAVADRGLSLDEVRIERAIVEDRRVIRAASDRTVKPTSPQLTATSGSNVNPATSATISWSVDSDQFQSR